jgi:hypothetical protein
LSLWIVRGEKEKREGSCVSQKKAKDGHPLPSTENEAKRDDTRERKKTTYTIKV